MSLYHPTNDSIRNLILYGTLGSAILGGCKNNLEQTVQQEQVTPDSYIYLGIRGGPVVSQAFNKGYKTDIANLDFLIKLTEDPNKKNEPGIANLISSPNKKEELTLVKDYVKKIHNTGADYFIGFFTNPALASSIDPKIDKKNFTHFIGDFTQQEIDKIKRYQKNRFDRKEKDFLVRRLR